MGELLHTVLAFLFAISVLVAVHEWGHYIVARAVGVKVLRFSIGFGRKLIGWTSAKSQVEYRVAWLPLGGYVKMLDEREGPVADEDLHRAFNRQSLWRRVAVVVAGPGMNFLFAIGAFWLVFVIGVSGMKPKLDEVPEHSRAHMAGLRGGDLVLAVDNVPIKTFSDLRKTLMEGALDGANPVISVQRGGLQKNLLLMLDDISADPEQLFPAVGMYPYRPSGAPVVRQLVSGSPASMAGLEPGDVILSADGTRFADVRDFVTWVQAHPGARVELEIRRGEQTVTRSLRLDAALEKNRTVGKLGAHLGVDVNPQIWQDLRATQRFGPVEAVGLAMVETWRLTALTVRMLGRMLVGDVSVRNIGGPIQIAEYAGATANIGLVSFLEFMALVSVSLGVLNLLPIPILDGGHLLYYLVEAVRRRPVSMRAQLVGQQVGIFLLLALMSVAFYNDLYRLGQG